MRLFATVLITASALVLTGSTVATADDRPPSTVEDFSYPNADQIFAERGIRLVSGDGHILLVDCAPGSAGQIAVRSSKFNAPICFKASGPVGRLTMSIPDVYSVKSDNHQGSATVSTAAGVSTTALKANSWAPIGNGDPGATLQEIKIWT